MTLTIIALACLSVLATQAPPEPPTARIFGLVRTLDQKPWTGAKVSLLARPLADVDCGVPHRVDLETDRRGRFRGEVRRDWVYSAWAIGDGDEGRFRTTKIVSDITAGTPVILEEVEPRKPGRVTVRGLEAWAAHAPFEYRLVGTVTDLAVDDDDGGFMTPVAPEPWFQVHVLGKHDRWIWSGQSTAGGTLSVPAPRRVLVRARVPAGAKLSNAEFGIEVRGRVCRLAELDENGEALVDVPTDASVWGYRVFADGFAPGVFKDFSVADTDDARGAKVIEAGGQIWSGELVTGGTLRGRLLFGPGRPASRCEIVVDSEAQAEVEENSFYGAQSLRVFETDATGRFEIPSVGKNGSTLRLLVPSDRWSELPPAWRAGVSPVALLERGFDPPAKDRGDVDLSRTHWVAELRVKTVEGTPADGARIRVHAQSPSVTARADRSGVLRMVLPIGECEMAAEQGAWWVRRLISDGAPTEPVAMEFALDGSVELRCTVVDSDGEPLPKASPWIYPDWQSDFAYLPDGGESFGSAAFTVRAEPVEPAILKNFLHSLISASIRERRDGAFVWRLPPIEGRMRVNASSGGAFGNETTAGIGAEGGEIELVLPRKHE